MCMLCKILGEMMRREKIDHRAEAQRHLDGLNEYYNVYMSRVFRVVQARNDDPNYLELRMYRIVETPNDPQFTRRASDTQYKILCTLRDDWTPERIRLQIEFHTQKYLDLIKPDIAIIL